MPMQDNTIAVINDKACNSGIISTASPVIQASHAPTIEFSVLVSSFIVYSFIGENGGAGLDTYSPKGKVKIQFHSGLLTISCLS